jgi:hypothetical protein
MKVDARLRSDNLKQLCCTNNIGFDEYEWTINAAIDVALSGEMHNRVDLVLAASTRDKLRVPDIRTHEGISIGVNVAGNVFYIARVGQQIHVDDTASKFRISKEPANHCRTNEATAAGNE